jgi:hypothetical protein
MKEYRVKRFNYLEYLGLCQIRGLETNERLGQIFFNVLYDIRPEEANKIRGTENDPFFSSDVEDERFINFIVYLDTINWSSEKAKKNEDEREHSEPSGSIDPVSE